MNPSLGAHGKAATFTGQDGCLAPKAQEIATSKVFGNMGTGGVGGVNAAAIPNKSAAFEPDESCEDYSGDPRDAGGSYGRSAGMNKRP